MYRHATRQAGRQNETSNPPWMHCARGERGEAMEGGGCCLVAHLQTAPNRGWMAPRGGAVRGRMGPSAPAHAHPPGAKTHGLRPRTHPTLHTLFPPPPPLPPHTPDTHKWSHPGPLLPHAPPRRQQPPGAAHPRFAPRRGPVRAPRSAGFNSGGDNPLFVPVIPSNTFYQLPLTHHQPNSSQPNTIQYTTIEYCTTLCNTVQHCQTQSKTCSSNVCISLHPSPLAFPTPQSTLFRCCVERSFIVFGFGFRFRFGFGIVVALTSSMTNTSTHPLHRYCCYIL